MTARSAEKTRPAGSGRRPRNHANPDDARLVMLLLSSLDGDADGRRRRRLLRECERAHARGYNAGHLLDRLYEAALIADALEESLSAHECPGAGCRRCRLVALLGRLGRDAGRRAHALYALLPTPPADVRLPPPPPTRVSPRTPEPTGDQR